jgi:hypothetical protein
MQSKAALVAHTEVGVREKQPLVFPGRGWSTREKERVAAGKKTGRKLSLIWRRSKG